MRIAEVVIANNSRELNKKFSYIVPDEMCVLPGARVVVPFGRGNKTVEGIVTGFADKSNYTKLKAITRLIDEKPLCTLKLLDLADYIQRTSVCTYYQALRLVVASGSKIKTTRWITLLNSDVDIEKVSGRSASKKKLLEILKDAGGTVDYGAASWVPNVSTAIKSLEKEGIISLDDTVAQNVGTKLVRMVRLTDMAEFNEDFSTLHKRAPKQFKMLEILRQTGDVSAADIVAFSNGSYAALNSLEQKGIIEFYDKKIYRNAFDVSNYKKTEKKVLTDEQKYVLESLINNQKKR